MYSLVLGKLVCDYWLAVLTVPFRFITENVNLISKLADDTWEAPVKIFAHGEGINSVSWAPLISFEQIVIINKKE